MCGEFDEDDKFIYEYYYPYLKGTGITSVEDVSVERHAAKDSYAGVCDDIKVGATIIFYLQNRLPYVNAQTAGRLPIRGTTLTLSGLSLSGSIMMPIMKDDAQKERLIKMEGEREEHATVTSQAFDENGKQVGVKNIHKLIRKGGGRWYVDDYEIRF